MMVCRPLTPINPCPNCGMQPTLKVTLLRGSRMECKCGVAGPFVRGTDWNEHEARSAWSAAVAGHPILHRPKAPARFGKS